MNDITLRRKHGKPPADARKAAEHMASRLKEKFDLDCTWEKEGANDVLRFTRPGLSGSLALEEQEVVVGVQLGFPFSALKPVIEQKLHKFLDENFPG